MTILVEQLSPFSECTLPFKENTFMGRKMRESIPGFLAFLPSTFPIIANVSQFMYTRFCEKSSCSFSASTTVSTHRLEHA